MLKLLIFSSTIWSFGCSVITGRGTGKNRNTYANIQLQLHIIMYVNNYIAIYTYTRRTKKTEFNKWNRDHFLQQKVRKQEITTDMWFAVITIACTNTKQSSDLLKV